MKKSQSMMSRGNDINSTYSQLSLKTSMIMTLNPKDKIPEHVLMRITKEADTLVLEAS
jgi:hypothetical protein